MANEKGNLPDNEKGFMINMTYVISRESFKFDSKFLFIIDNLCLITDIPSQISLKTIISKVFFIKLVLLT